MIGILMVNSESGPDTAKLGWSRTRWHALLYIGAILAFCSISPVRFPWSKSPAAGEQRARKFRIATIVLRTVGFATLIVLAFAYRNRRDARIITLSPFSIRTEWYGILGLIGWAYLAAAIVYLVFRNHRTALLACVAIMTAFFAADRKGFFDGLFVSRFVDMGGTLGSQAAITVAGVMLATILVTDDTATAWSRVRFTLLFSLGFAVAAMVTTPLFGISKNDATPAWCLWSSAITAAAWLLFYLIGDVARARWLIWPLAIAGSNVLLAYLISEGLGSWFSLLHLGKWYGRLAEPTLGHAVARSATCAALILALSALLNRVGFRLKL
jgi:predicted acyltransferase